jgi:hypothetical protein
MMCRSLAFILFFTFAWTVEGKAAGLLDGSVFVGMIGPAENPDLSDSLSFDEGHFWSDICTRCGFVPGPYRAEKTEDGIVFSGRLESESRGRFDYEGTVSEDGTIVVSVLWQRRRWYWISKREILFLGARSAHKQIASLTKIREQMQTLDPEGNPLCARF